MTKNAEIELSSGPYALCADDRNPDDFRNKNNVPSPIDNKAFSSGVDTIRGLTGRALCVNASLHTMKNRPNSNRQ